MASGMHKAEMRPALREALLEAMLRELGERGREGISVAPVLARIDVSPEEFAAEFTDLEACLDAAYDQLAVQIAAAVRTSCDRRSAGLEPAWPDRVRGGLAALLAELAADPLRARTLIRTYPSLGSHAQARYHSFVEGFAPLLAAGREFSGVAAELPASVETLALGAAEAIVFEEVASERTATLPGLLPSLLFSLLVPFLGPAEAAAEMEKARH
jgi:AcrR family transcriptional regulator